MFTSFRNYLKLSVSSARHILSPVFKWVERSRKNTPEEKLKQKRQKKNVGNLTLLTNTKVLPGINDGPNVAETSLKDR